MITDMTWEIKSGLLGDQMDRFGSWSAWPKKWARLERWSNNINISGFPRAPGSVLPPFYVLGMNTALLWTLRSKKGSRMSSCLKQLSLYWSQISNNRKCSPGRNPKVMPRMQCRLAWPCHLGQEEAQAQHNWAVQCMVWTMDDASDSSELIPQVEELR